MSDFSDSLQYEKLIFLKNVGCCLTCSLRFCGVNLLEQSRCPEALIFKVKHLRDYKPLDDKVPCITCLGILQIHHSSSYINMMLEELELFKYDCKTFSLQLNIPTCIQLRDRAVYIYLNQLANFSANYKSKIKIQNIKDIWKWYLIPKFESVLNKRIETMNPNSSVVIDISILYEKDQEECLELIKNYEQLSNNKIFNKISREKNVNKKIIDTIMAAISDEQFEKYFSVPPKAPNMFATFDKLLCKHDSIFIAGRYLKLSRRLCQTPWYINGQCKMENSVQDFLCQYIIDYTKCESIKFISSGREDVDVRMLFYGRPFAIELINPKITQISKSVLLNLDTKINNSTEKIKTINGLTIITKNRLKKLKEGECSKSKTYRALCIFKEIVDKAFLIKTLQNIKNLKIIQKTPLRVVHRRPLSPRERIIHEVRARFPSSKELNTYRKQLKFIRDDWSYVIIDLKTQAGTYIKEFVHGDFGRTTPNLCYLLKTEIDIAALDVTNIGLIWP